MPLSPVLLDSTTAATTTATKVVCVPSEIPDYSDMQVRNDCPEMENDSLPLSPAPLEPTTAAMALTSLTIQAMCGTAEGIFSGSGVAGPASDMGTVTGKTDINKESGEHRVAAVVDAPFTSISAAPLHSANKNGLLAQENNGGEALFIYLEFIHNLVIGSAGDPGLVAQNSLPPATLAVLPEENSSLSSSGAPTSEPSTLKYPELASPAASANPGGQTKKGTKMRPNASLTARSATFQNFTVAH